MKCPFCSQEFDCLKNLDDHIDRCQDYFEARESRKANYNKKAKNKVVVRYEFLGKFIQQ